MAYTPRASREILRDMAARVVTRTDLTDLHEGSVLYDLLAVVAEQIAESDVRLAQIRDQFTADGASGVDLDERVEELGFSRLGATTAQGAVTLSRVDTTEALVVPEGSVVGRSDSAVTYATASDVTFAIGVSNVSVLVKAQASGAQGNAPSSTLNVLVDLPSDVTAVTQTTPITNGQDAESDESLRARARRFMNSLSRCQPSALEYTALSFTASDDTRATVATIYEDPVSLGRVELLIDDGSGLGDNPSTRAGAAVTQQVSAADVTIINIERAVVSGPVVTRRRSGLSTPLTEGVDYRVNRGAGVVSLLEGANVLVGDSVTVSTYSVYDGLVGELQAYIEGDPNDPSTGHRAAGVALRVLPAPVQRASFDLLLTVADGANITTATAQARSACVSYLASLSAGAPAFIARVIDAVMSVDNVINVKVLRSDTDESADDQYPSTPRHVIRSGQVRAITSTTGA